MSKNQLFEKVKAPNPADAPPDMNTNPNKGYAPAGRGDAKVSADKLPPPKPPADEKVDYDAYKKWQQQHAGEGVSTKVPINPRTGVEWRRDDEGAETDPQSPWFVAVDYNPSTGTAGAAPAGEVPRPPTEEGVPKVARAVDPVVREAAKKFLDSSVGRRYVSMFERFAKPVFAVSAVFIGWVLYHQYANRKQGYEAAVKESTLSREPIRLGGSGGGGNYNYSNYGGGSGLLAETVKQSGETTREIIRGVGEVSGYGVKRGVDLIGDLTRGIGRLGDDAFRANYTDASGKVLPVVAAKAWAAAGGLLETNSKLKKKREAADRIIAELKKVAGAKDLDDLLERKPKTFTTVLEISDIVNGNADNAAKKQKLVELLTEDMEVDEEEAEVSADSILLIPDVPLRTEIGEMFRASVAAMMKQIPRAERIAAAERKIEAAPEIKVIISEAPAAEQKPAVEAIAETIVELEEIAVVEQNTEEGPRYVQLPTITETLDSLRETLTQIKGYIAGKANAIVEWVREQNRLRQQARDQRAEEERQRIRKANIDRLTNSFLNTPSTETLRKSILEILKNEENFRGIIEFLKLANISIKQINNENRRGQIVRAVYEALYEVLLIEYTRESLDNINTIQDMALSFDTNMAKNLFAEFERNVRAKERSYYEPPEERVAATQGTITTTQKDPPLPALSRRQQPQPLLKEENILMTGETEKPKTQKTVEGNLLDLPAPKQELGEAAAAKVPLVVAPKPLSFEEANDRKIDFMDAQNYIINNYTGQSMQIESGRLEALMDSIKDAAAQGLKWSEAENQEKYYMDKLFADKISKWPKSNNLPKSLSFAEANDRNINFINAFNYIKDNFKGLKQAQKKGEVMTLQEAIEAAAKQGKKWSEVENSEKYKHEKDTADEILSWPKPDISAFAATLAKTAKEDPKSDEFFQQTMAAGLGSDADEFQQHLSGKK